MSVNVEALADEVFTAASASIRPGARVERRPFGEIVTNPDFPAVFFLHGVEDLVAPDWSAADLEAVVDAAIPYAPTYRASSRHPLTRERFGNRLVAVGYEPQQFALMTQVFPPEVEPAPAFRISEARSAETWADFEALVREDWARQPAPAATQLLAFYRWMVDNAPQRFHLAYDRERPVTHAGLYQHGFVGYVHGVFTRPADRRRGAAAWLMRKVEGEARASGCERVVLRCDRDSTLPAYYERLGFRVVGEATVWSKPRQLR